MNKRFLAAGGVVALIVASACFAGIRSAGKYAGVVVFDRWGGCTLYSGVYVMYVSEAVKDGLRSRAGQCVEIDATKVEQPMNPGDGLIKAFTYLGVPPVAPDWAAPVSGVKLTLRPTFHDGERPAFELRVENVGDRPVTLLLDELAPTVLARHGKGADPWGPSDGPSSAVVTRDAFWVDESRVEGANDTWHWSVTSPAKFDRRVEVEPKGVFTVDLALRLPPGQYDVLAGYGGGVQQYQCVASNLTGIDVATDGRATLPKVDGR